MNTVKIGTFNVENLFARFKFNKNVKNIEKALTEGWTVNDTLFTINNPTEKRITAEAILALDADVLTLQEVENLITLKRFRSDYLGGRKSYPYLVCLTGTDPRRIDLGILSRYPIKNIQTYADLWSTEARRYVFSRDCLEVDVLLPGNEVITLFVNHLKSMIGGRSATREARLTQSEKILDIVTSRFGENAGEHHFIILGDFNDYPESDDQGESGILSLVNWEQVENVVLRLPAEEQWTHFYKKRQDYKQLDYILLSKSLAAANPNKPYIERRGLPKRAKRVVSGRFSGVGENSPKASDHCPIVMEFKYQ